LLRVEDLSDAMLRTAQVELRLAICRPVARAPDVSRERYELAAQVRSGILGQRLWWRAEPSARSGVGR
jgi:hypothetical protein